MLQFARRALLLPADTCDARLSGIAGAHPLLADLEAVAAQGLAWRREWVGCVEACELCEDALWGVRSRTREAGVRGHLWYLPDEHCDNELDLLHVCVRATESGSQCEA